ncbi:MAG TPA: hypothetical protein VFA23_04070 [Dongiaceae bacterium]|nr:hypothetical protein [Dongiaceae bacterium]
MDATAVFLSLLVGFTSLLGLGALIGLIASTWFILFPLLLLGMALVFIGSGLGAQAALSGVLLAGVLWAEYRVWRG